jgi:hypothetical protein
MINIYCYLNNKQLLFISKLLLKLLNYNLFSSLLIIILELIIYNYY